MQSGHDSRVATATRPCRHYPDTISHDEFHSKWGGTLNLSKTRKEYDKPLLRHALAAPMAFYVLVVLLAIFAAPTVRAQGTSLLSSSYITPFPQTDRYQLRVVGDWLGTGLTEGLKEAFKQESSLEIADMSRSNYGLVRGDQIDLYGEIDRMIAGPPVHVAVIMLGVNDRASIRAGAGRAQPGTAEWKEAYAKEAEKLIKKLKGANIAVYWVGLPVMGNPAFSESAAQMNDAVRQAAYVNGVKFIETWAGFTDQLGNYSAYGPDLTGQTKRLREGDGVGLTAPGYRKLANYVETALRRDLAHAKGQRNIPLAGDEEEQARVVPNASHTFSAAKGTAGPSNSPTSEVGSNQSNEAAGKPPSGANVSDFNAETVTRPVAAQDVQKRDQAAFGGAGYQGGEFILSDLGDGLTAIAVISPAGDFSMREIQRQTPLADRVYFKVLSRGDALPPKEGRADDFRWQGEAAAQSH